MMSQVSFTNNIEPYTRLQARLSLVFAGLSRCIAMQLDAHHLLKLNAYPGLTLRLLSLLGGHRLDDFFFLEVVADKSSYK